MAIAKGAVALLYELEQMTLLSGTVCQLERQGAHLPGDQLGLIANRFGFSATVADKIDDVKVFESLGFTSVEIVDYSDFEHPTHVLDLNLPPSKTASYFCLKNESRANRSAGALRTVRSRIAGSRFLEPGFRAVWNAFHRSFPELRNRRPPVIARY